MNMGSRVSENYCHGQVKFLHSAIIVLVQDFMGEVHPYHVHRTQSTLFMKRRQASHVDKPDTARSGTTTLPLETTVDLVQLTYREGGSSAESVSFNFKNDCKAPMVHPTLLVKTTHPGCSPGWISSWSFSHMSSANASTSWSPVIVEAEMTLIQPMTPPGSQRVRNNHLSTEQREFCFKQCRFTEKNRPQNNLALTLTTALIPSTVSGGLAVCPRLLVPIATITVFRQRFSHVKCVDIEGKRRMLK